MPASASTDGLLIVPSTHNAGKKPRQHKRGCNAKTTCLAATKLRTSEKTSRYTTINLFLLTELFEKFRQCAVANLIQNKQAVNINVNFNFKLDF